MAQFEPLREELEKLQASLVYVAAEKRAGIFRPEQYFREHPVRFPFLLDEDRAVTKAWGVYHRIGKDAFNIARPATFVVDRAGAARFIYVGQDQHDRAPIEQVLDALRAI